MKRKRLSWILAIVAMGCLAGTARTQEITGNHRLVESFIQDGAILRQGWLEAGAGYSDGGGGGHDFAAGTLVAFSALERLEVGGRVSYLDRTRSRNEVLFGERLSSDIDENGLGDLDLYGKFRFGTHPRDWSAGLVVKIPAGDDRERLGSGRTDYAVFLATRRTFEEFAWIGNASVRVNGDSRTPGGGSGKMSGSLGGGAIFRISYSWSFMAEARYETRRYEGGDVDFRITPSLDFRPTENLALRLGVALGLADGSPDQEAAFSVVFHF
jgi:hypothetical protein